MKKYNATVGGYESRVLSRARKFADYEIPGVESGIQEMGQVEETPRLLRDASGDLFPDDDDSQDAA